MERRIEWPPTREALYDLYITQGWNLREIGHLAGKSEGAVHWHLCKYDIPRRRRGF
jgi:DNA-directed RNA polymerase specialized sigma24 family protein